MTISISRAVEALLGCRHPVVLAGTGGVARSDLVAAVTRAGGFGFLGMVREPVALIRQEVEALRAAGVDNFGVNIIPAATDRGLLADQVQTILDLGVPAVTLFWEIDGDVVRRFREAGIIVVHQIGSAEEAIAAERAGAQALIAQGCEAGGHVRGTTPLRSLLPAVVEAVGVPVLAAGGLATGADLITAQALGAGGIVLGTAFIATPESFAHPHHQQRLIAAAAEDTLLTDIFHINWPHGAKVRVLQNAVTSGTQGDPWTGERRVIGEEEGRPIYLFSTDSPLRSMTGDFESMALYAGTGVDAIRRVKSAGEVIDDILQEARALLASSGDSEAQDRASPVCYADEVNLAYMGLLEEEAASVETSGLVELLRVGLFAALNAKRGGDGPPFGRSGLLFARHLLALRPFADPEVSTPRPTNVVPATLPAILLQRLQRLLPRLPEGARRQAVAAMMRDLEAEMLLPSG